MKKFKCEITVMMLRSQERIFAKRAQLSQIRQIEYKYNVQIEMTKSFKRKIKSPVKNTKNENADAGFGAGAETRLDNEFRFEDRNNLTANL